MRLLADARVLVVDDEVDLSENLREILEDEGAQVRTLATAAEARKVDTRDFDVALVDVRLPDATGLQLLREFRDRAADPFEVLLVTGNASLEDAIAAVAAGAYAYVLKPFDPHDLLANVARALGKVRLQTEARTLAQALERREFDLRMLVEMVQALLLELDDEGRVLQASPAVEQATGVARSEILGADWVECFVPEAEREELRGLLRAAVQQRRPVAGEHRVLRVGAVDGGRPGQVRCVQWSFSAVPRQRGGHRIYASGLDVTELRELADRARLAEKLAAVGTLAAGLAHEIRNPLNAAALQLQLLERRAGRTQEAAPLLPIVATVQSEIGRLSRLVDDFLGFARPATLRPRVVDLRRLVAHVVELERPEAGAQGIDLEARLPQDPVEVVGDREKLEQVLLNLVRNATDAVGEARARDPERPRWVQAGVTCEAGVAVLRVRDSGCGIPPENLPRIFEPFFSTKDAGTGLGMAICHSLVTLHGGEIRVESSNAGSTFDVRLPLGGPPGPAV
jgi:PAS domain S-box-containing protein